MGFWDRFRKRDAGAPAQAPEADSAPEAAESEIPDVVAIARRGMDIPPEDYMSAVLAADCPAALGAVTVKVALSQPRWPANAALMDSTVSGIVRAMAREHEIHPGKSSYVETQGPDGAQVILVMMWR